MDYPPIAKHAAYIAHYLRCESRVPGTTSACVCLFTLSVSQPLVLCCVEVLSALAHFFKGSPLYVAATDGASVDGVAHSVHVYDDPCKAVLNALLHPTESESLECEAQVAGVAAQVLYNTCAAESFVYQPFAESMSLPVDRPMHHPPPMRNASGLFLFPSLQRIENMHAGIAQASWEVGGGVPRWLQD